MEKVFVKKIISHSIDMNGNFISSWIIEYLKTLSNNGYLLSTFQSLNKLLTENLNGNDNNGYGEGSDGNGGCYGLTRDQLNRLLIEFKYEFHENKTININTQKYYYHIIHKNIEKYVIPPTTTTTTLDNRNLDIAPLFVHLLDIFRNNRNNLISNVPSSMSKLSLSNENSGNLFLKIWKNKVIRKVILYHLTIFRNNYSQVQFNSVTQLHFYKYKNYLRNIRLNLSKASLLFEEFNINDYLENMLSPTIQVLEIFGNYSGYIKPKSIPSSITSLKFGQEHSDKIKHIKLNIPLGDRNYNELSFKTSIKKIEFSKYFISKINIGSIPNFIEKVKLNPSWYYPIKLSKDIYPVNLKSLYLGPLMFTKGSEFPDLPNSITKLKYHGIPEIPINSLPSNLTDLTIGKNYKSIQFGKKSTAAVSSTTSTNVNGNILFSPYLKKLSILYNGFQLSTDLILPFNLVVLKLRRDFFQTFQPGVLPKTLEYLSFQEGDDNTSGGNNGNGIDSQNGESSFIKNPFKSFKPCLIKGSLPSSLKTLKLSPFIHHIDTLTEQVLSQCTSLTHLSIIPTRANDYKSGNKKIMNDPFSKSTEWSKSLKFIPLSLLKIKCESALGFPFFLSTLPSTCFEFTLNFSQFPTTKILPNTITTLIFNATFNNDIPIGVLPESLTILKFGSLYNKPILQGIIPKSLTSLSFLNNQVDNNNKDFRYDNNNNNSNNHNFNNFNHFKLVSQFNQSLDIGLLFPSLKTLFIGSSNPSSLVFDEITCPNFENLIIYNNNLQFLNNCNIDLNNPLLKVIDYNIKNKDLNKLLK